MKPRHDAGVGLDGVALAALQRIGQPLDRLFAEDSSFALFLSAPCLAIACAACGLGRNGRAGLGLEGGSGLVGDDLTIHGVLPFSAPKLLVRGAQGEAGRSQGQGLHSWGYQRSVWGSQESRSPQCRQGAAVVRVSQRRTEGRRGGESTPFSIT